MFARATKKVLKINGGCRTDKPTDGRTELEKFVNFRGLNGNFRALCTICDGCRLLNSTSEAVCHWDSCRSLWEGRFVSRKFAFSPRIFSPVAGWRSQRAGRPRSDSPSRWRVRPGTRTSAPGGGRAAFRACARTPTAHLAASPTSPGASASSLRPATAPASPATRGTRTARRRALPRPRSRRPGRAPS